MQEYLWKELLSLPFFDAGIGIQQYFFTFQVQCFDEPVFTQIMSYGLHGLSDSKKL